MNDQIKLDEDQTYLALRDLLNREEQTLWDQGDLLVRDNVTDARLYIYCKALGRRPGTLRRRRQVSFEFPESGGLRDYRNCFGVYETLLRIPTEEARAGLLGERPVWKKEQMARRVSEWIRDHVDQIDRMGRPRGKANMKLRQGMSLGDDLYIRAERRGTDNVEIYIEHINVRFVESSEADGLVQIKLKLS